MLGKQGDIAAIFELNFLFETVHITDNIIVSLRKTFHKTPKLSVHHDGESPLITWDGKGNVTVTAFDAPICNL